MIVVECFQKSEWDIPDVFLPFIDHLYKDNTSDLELKISRIEGV